jgi:hypothetical protein
MAEVEPPQEGISCRRGDVGVLRPSCEEGEKTKADCKGDGVSGKAGNGVLGESVRGGRFGEYITNELVSGALRELEDFGERGGDSCSCNLADNDRLDTEVVREITEDAVELGVSRPADNSAISSGG